jgi:hypothetical protein
MCACTLLIDLLIRESWQQIHLYHITVTVPVVQVTESNYQRLMVTV